MGGEAFTHEKLRGNIWEEVGGNHFPAGQWIRQSQVLHADPQNSLVHHPVQDCRQFQHWQQVHVVRLRNATSHRCASVCVLSPVQHTGILMLSRPKRLHRARGSVATFSQSCWWQIVSKVAPCKTALTEMIE